MPEITPPTPRLRPARIEDLDVVLPWAPDAESMRMWAGPTIGFPVGREQLWENLHHVPGAPFTLCAADGEIVGFGQVMHREEDFAHLARIIVAPAHRGQGLGRVLCLELMEVATTFLPVRAFSLYVYPENTRAHALYRSLGFFDAREERGFLRMEKLGLDTR
jgi:ribosomal protein S18 acetylase RimI-like enzyme